MRKKIIFILIFSIGVLSPVQQAQAAIPWAAIIKAAIKKVVKAVDLLVQRRQNAVIKLQNAQKALENTMAKLKLDQIEDWVKKQRDLYKEYYDELKKVKAVIAYYSKVKQISEKQARILKEYQRGWNLFSSDKHISASELIYMQKVYAGMLDQTVKTTEMLTAIVTSFSTQMTDAERLKTINELEASVQKIFDELSSFNQKTRLLSLSRAKSESEAKSVKQLYGIE